ncbi:MAG: hypothetical protein WDN06_05715, partial [Asticcacaulis sp.]
RGVLIGQTYLADLILCHRSPFLPALIHGRASGMIYTHQAIWVTDVTQSFAAPRRRSETKT